MVISVGGATQRELARVRYWEVYAYRFASTTMTWGMIKTKAHAATDRLYETKPELVLHEVYADVEQYIRQNGECYLAVTEMSGLNISKCDSNTIEATEHLYFCRMPWKKMSLPFVDHILRQAGMRR